MTKSNTEAHSVSPKVSDEYRLSSVEPPAPAADPIHDNQNPSTNGATLASPADADVSCEIATHLSQARAIADLVFTACGMMSDGSDSSIEELCVGTLSNAMNCIMQNLDEAERLQSEMSAWETQVKVEAMRKAGDQGNGASAPKASH
jgi:hypothetical protein